MAAASTRDAIRHLEAKANKKVSEMKEVKLNGHYPPIDKMDPTLAQLQKCEKLSLSTNMIDKITNLNGLRRLRVLSLGRNSIKSLSGIEAVSDSLEELWVSYNQIEKLKGVASLKKLKVLLISNNLIKDWAEINRIVELQFLVELNFLGNPLEERCSAEGIWRRECIRRLPNLVKLDGLHVTMDNFGDDSLDENELHQFIDSQQSVEKSKASFTEESLVSKTEVEGNNTDEVAPHIHSLSLGAVSVTEEQLAESVSGAGFIAIPSCDD